MSAPARPRSLLVLVPALSLVLALSVLPSAGSPRKKAEEPESSEGDRKAFAEIVRNHEKMEGILTLYRSPDHLYADIPGDLMDKPLGLSGILVKAVGDWSIRGGGIETQVVTFSRLGDHVRLAKKNLDYQADPSSTLRLAVESTFPDSPVFLTKAVPTREKRPASLVDLSGLFSPDLMEFLSPRLGYSAGPEDASVASVRVHPDNLVVRMVYRLRRKEGPDRGEDEEGARSPGRLIAPRLPDARFLEATVDYNLYRLPDDGFRPRVADERIGGFAHSHKDYTDVGHRDSAFRHFFVRWNLEKTDPRADVSPAKEPITFYIDQATPPEWRPRIREAALWWNRAFEKVGIRDALRVLDQPDDPDWHPTDLHHSMIYWNLSDNLMFSGLAGAMVTDPRTGQILKGGVYLNGEFPSFALHRYLVYAWWRAPQSDRSRDPFLLPATGTGASASRLAALPSSPAGSPIRCDLSASFSSQLAFARLVLQARGVLGDDPEGRDRFAREAFAELVAHEVGHALGFSHNFKASLVSGASDLAAGRVSGHPDQRPFTTSVMDYSPIYLSPPGKPQGDYFMRAVGPFDDLLVEYLYRPFPGASPAEEARELARIAKAAETAPGMMFDDGDLSEIDPTSNTDDLGDDPLGFAADRLTMIQKEVLPRIAELVTAEGHDYNVVRQALDAAIFSVALDYIDITARHVGGQYARRVVADGGRSGPPLTPPLVPVDPDVQRRALGVLDRLVFDPAAFPATPELLALLKADLLADWNYPYRYAADYSFDNRMVFLYDSALATLLQPRRLARVLDNERRLAQGSLPLTLPELFSHLQSTAFAGLEKAGLAKSSPSSPAIPVRRRALQRLLVSRCSGLVLSPESGTPAEAGQAARAGLMEIRARLRRLTGSAQRLAALDASSRAHLLDLEATITRTLEARTVLPAGS